MPILTLNEDWPLRANTLQARTIENIPGGVMRISSHSWGMTLNIDTDNTGSDQFNITRGSGANETVLLRIDGNNNVGIGTSNPQERLHVNGRIKANNLGYLGWSNGLQGASVELLDSLTGSANYGSVMAASPVNQSQTGTATHSANSAGTDVSKAYTEAHWYAFGNAFMMYGSTFVNHSNQIKPLFFAGERFLRLRFPVTPVLNALGLANPYGLVFNVMVHTDFYNGHVHFTDWDSTSYYADAIYVLMGHAPNWHNTHNAYVLEVLIRRLRFTGSDGYLRPVVQVIGHML